MLHLTLMDAQEKTWLVIPTKDRTEYLRGIFDASNIPEERRVLVRTQIGPIFPGAINIFSLGEVNIQRWWNYGIRYARDRGARFVAILNDDVIMSEGVIQRLVDKMIESKCIFGHARSSNDWSWGHFFIVDIESDLEPDEQFYWAYGDNDLKEQALNLGDVCIIDEIVENIHHNEVTASNSQLLQLSKQDSSSFRKKHPSPRQTLFYLGN